MFGVGKTNIRLWSPTLFPARCAGTSASFLLHGLSTLFYSHFDEFNDRDSSYHSTRSGLTDRAIVNAPLPQYRASLRIESVAFVARILLPVHVVPRDDMKLFVAWSTRLTMTSTTKITSGTVCTISLHSNPRCLSTD